MKQESVCLTPAQREAVQSLDADCIVSAGAGSGKTRVLVERFLHILDRFGDDPELTEKMVAITFTEKAATEMKDRVRKGMKERLRHARRQKNVVEEQRWYRMLTESERIRITTIHSFCTRLLQDYPIEAGVEPGFSVMNEVEAQLLLKESVEASLSPMMDCPGANYLEQWMTSRSFERCISTLTDVYSMMVGNGWRPEDLARRTSDHLSMVTRQLEDKWRSGKDSLLLASAPLMDVNGGKKVTEFQSAWPDLKREIVSAGDPKALLPILEEANHLLKGNWGRKEEIVSLRHRMKEHLEHMLEVTQGLLLLPTEQKMTEGICCLLEMVDRRFAQAKQERSMLDFDDLQTRAVRLLREHPDVLNRERDRIQYLMVDEYQDTNDAQKQLVDLLCEPHACPGKLFVVGDPKQSIYRFRGAEVNVFGQTRKEILSRDGREVVLVDNFRSDVYLVDFVNGLFSRLMSQDRNSPNYYQETIARQDSTGEGRVEFFSVPDQKACPNGKDPRMIEAAGIARRIRQLIDEGTPPGEIAVLFQAMTHIKKYEQELVRQGIPFYVVKGRGFYDRQEVMDVLHYLRFLADPEDALALTGVLRSPFCGVSDETILALTREKDWMKSLECWMDIREISERERVKLKGFMAHLAKVRQWLGRISVAELIEHLLEDSGYRQVLWATPQGKQACANLDKLVSMARDEQIQPVYSLRSFLQSVEQWQTVQQETEATVEPAEGNSVKLMTIHQAKGLEFPVVFVPDLSRSPNRSDCDVSVDQQAGLVVRLQGITDTSGESYRWLRWLEKEKELEREESVRLFYVAATRAKSRLILSGQPLQHKGIKKGEGIFSAATWSEWLDALFGFCNMPEENGVWALDDKGLAMHVWFWKEEESMSPSVETSLLDHSEFPESTVSDPESEDMSVATAPRGWTPEDRKPISVSDFMLLVHCPRKYFYARILGLFFPERLMERESTDREKEEGISLSPQLKGEIVHKMIENISEAADETELEDLFSQVMNRFGISTIRRERVKTEIFSHLKTYRNSRLHQNRELNSEMKKEARFIHEWAGLEIEGVIDRLHRTSDGSWELVDYKTNDIEASRVMETAKEYLPQLQLYVLAAKEVWGLDVSQATLFFLKPDQEFSWKVDQQWIQQAKKKLVETADQLRQGKEIGDYPPDPGKQCRYCHYQRICEAFQ